MEVLPLGGPHPSGGSGGTLSSGTQDISAALLTLLGTEQCEDHILGLSPHRRAFSTTAATPMLIDLRQSLCVQTSCIGYVYASADVRRRLESSGRRGVQGTDLSLIVFDEERGCCCCEKRWQSGSMSKIATRSVVAA